MSTGARIPLLEARQIAEEFARLFEGCWERWVIAGSIRRQKPDIGDVEHVVIPRFAEVKVASGEPSLFGGDRAVKIETVNSLWAKADELLAAGVVAQAEYGETRSTRWGQKFRGMVYRGMKHEIFTADADNWGCVLIIRTGPSEYSERLVTDIKQRGVYRQQDGYLRIAGGDDAGKIVPCPNEETYFAYAQWAFKAPEERR